MKTTMLKCVVYAKDRLIQDFDNFLEHLFYYSEMNKVQRNNFRKRLKKFSQIMEMPDDSCETLNALMQSGYWKGNKDKFWEWNKPFSKLPENATLDLVLVE